MRSKYRVHISLCIPHFEMREKNSQTFLFPIKTQKETIHSFARKTHHTVFLVWRRLWTHTHSLIITSPTISPLSITTLSHYLIQEWTLEATTLCTPILLCNRKEITVITFTALSYIMALVSQSPHHCWGPVPNSIWATVGRHLSFPVISLYTQVNAQTTSLLVVDKSSSLN